MKSLMLAGLITLYPLPVHATFIPPEIGWTLTDHQSSKEDKDDEDDKKKEEKLEPIPPELKQMYPWPKKEEDEVQERLKKHQEDLENKLKKYDKKESK
jgi:hypothetical protein